MAKYQSQSLRKSANVQDLRGQGPVGRFIDRMGGGYGNLGQVLAEQWKIGAGWDPYAEARSNYEAMFGPGSWEQHVADVERLAQPPPMHSREIDRSVYREPGYAPNYRSESELMARDFTQMRDYYNQGVEAGKYSREDADRILANSWDNLQNQIQVDLDNGIIDAERAGGITQRVQTGAPFDLNAAPGDSQFQPSQSGAAGFAALPHALPGEDDRAVTPPWSDRVDPESGVYSYGPNGPQPVDPNSLDLNVNEPWSEKYLQNRDALPELRQFLGRKVSAGEVPQATTGTYSPPDMAGAFAGGEQLSPAVVQTIIAESLGEGPEGMRLVAETIINRARDRGITPEEVVMERGQYAPHSPQYKAGSAINLDDPDNIAAATAAWDAAQTAEDPTMGSEYFSVTGGKAPSAGERLQPVWEHGKHTFWNDTSGVKVMQQNLAAAGLYDGAIDGDFGPATKAAADAFRAQLGTDDPMQALTALGAEPAVGQEAIQNILQSPESLPAFGAPGAEVAATAPLPGQTDPRLDALRQRMETDPAALQEAMATTPLPNMGGQPLPEVLQAQAPAPAYTPPVSNIDQIMQQAQQQTVPTPTPGQDYNDILDAGAAAPPQPGQADRYMSPFGKYYDAFETERAGMRTAQAAPPQPGQPDRSDLTSAAPQPPAPFGRAGYGPSEVPDAPPDMAGAYADFETTRANVQSPQTLRDMMGQAGLDDSQWAATDLGIPSQSVPPSSLPPLMQQQYEQEALRDWARPQAPAPAPITPQSPLGDPRLEQMQEQQGRTFAPYNAPAEAATAADVRERLAAANPARLLQDERELASIARTQPIGPPESRNYRIAQGLKPDVLQTVAIGGPDAAPPMVTGGPPAPGETPVADIGLTAMPPPPEMSISDFNAMFEGAQTPEREQAVLDRVNARNAALRAAQTPAPVPAAAVAPEAPAASTGTHGAPTATGVQLATSNPDVLSYYGIERGAANLMSGGRMPGTRGGNLTTITSNNGQKFTVNADAAPSFLGFVNEMEANGYPVSSSGGYNERKKTGGKGWSEHSYGTAIDINSEDNPYQEDFDDGMTTDMPENVSDIAAKWGLTWGGDFDSVKDPMHFEWQGLTADQVAEGQANPVDLSSPDKVMAVQTALREAGHNITVDGVMGPETRAALATTAQTAQPAQTAAAEQQTMLSHVDNSGQVLKMAQAAEDAGGFHHIETVGDTVRIWKDAEQTVSGSWEQIEAAAAAGGPGVSIDYAQGVLNVAPSGPQATTSATTATGPTQPTAAVEAAPAATAPVSTMQDVARAAHEAGFIGRIEVDPATNRISGYNHAVDAGFGKGKFPDGQPGGNFPNGQPWTAEQRATIAAKVPGITVDEGGLRLAPAASVPEGVTGTTTAAEGRVQTGTPAEAAAPIETAAPPNMAPAQPSPPSAAEALQTGGSTSRTGAPMQSPSEAAAGVLGTVGDIFSSGTSAVGGALSTPSVRQGGLNPAATPPTSEPPTATAATPPPAATAGQAVSGGPARVQFTAPNMGAALGPIGPNNAGSLYPAEGQPMGVINTAQTYTPPVSQPLPTSNYGGVESLFSPAAASPINPTPVTTVPIDAPNQYAPADFQPPVQEFRLPQGVPGAPIPGTLEDPFADVPVMAPTSAPAPVQQLPANQYVTPSVAVPANTVPAAVTPPPAPAATTEKKQEEKPSFSERSKRYSDPIEYAARTATTEDGKFDHDKFWDQLGDVDLTQTQQTIAAKTAAAGHFTQNKLSGFLPNIGMPDMGGGLLNAVQGGLPNIPNPVQGLSNFFGNIFSGGVDPRSSGIGSDYAASQGGNYNTFGQQGPPGSSGNYGGSYSGPGSGSYGGGGMGGSQYGGGWGGGGGYSGAGTFGGAGGQNIAQGIGGAFRNR